MTQEQGSNLGASNAPALEVQREVTMLLGQIRQGDEAAKSALLELAYNELRGMAAGFMRRERANHTLQATALVNEAALRLMGSQALSHAESRAYFFGAMANAMRRILVDHARKSSAQRRGGGERPVPLDVVVHTVEEDQGVDLLALNEALDQLAEASPRQAEIVVLRFFGGLSIPEIAEHLDVSQSTVEKDWRVARAWLRGSLGES